MARDRNRPLGLLTGTDVYALFTMMMIIMMMKRKEIIALAKIVTIKHKYNMEKCGVSCVKSSVNPLQTKRRLLYLKTRFLPRCKHFSSRL